jgi:hypothetical protein
MSFNRLTVQFASADYRGEHAVTTCELALVKKPFVFPGFGSL